MIALDTNILIYAHRVDASQHSQAAVVVSALGSGSQTWALPWPCLHEFYAQVTSTKWPRPTPPREAIAIMRKLAGLNSVRVIGEGLNHLDWLDRVVKATGNVHGGGIHDARIAAICLAHGVNELWTADRDFSRFPELKTRNPLAA